MVGVSTEDGLETLDVWLGEYSRSLCPFRDQQIFRAIFDETVSGRVSPQHFTPIKTIGKGGFSKVVLARKRDAGVLYAIKIINKEFLLKEQKIPQILHEKQILERTENPFLVKLHWVYQTAVEIHFVMDFCPGGELFFHLQRTGKLCEQTAKFYFAEIVLALSHLHSHSIAYRDLKPENILLDLDGHIVLVDFGLSKSIDQSKTYSFCGSAEYMSPEMLQKSGHGKEVDFYSLGCLLYEMLVGLPPFYHNDTQEMFRRIVHEDIQVPNWVGRKAKELIQSLLHKNIRRRLVSFGELKRHPWLTDVDWDRMYNKRGTPPIQPSLELSNFDEKYTAIPVDPESFTAKRLSRLDKDDQFARFSRKAKPHSYSLRFNRQNYLKEIKPPRELDLKNTPRYSAQSLISPIQSNLRLDAIPVKIPHL